MADEVRVRLNIDTSQGVQNIKDLASNVQNGLGKIKGGVKLIDEKSLIAAQKQIQALSKELEKAKQAGAASFDTKGVLALSKALGQSFSETQKFTQTLGLASQTASQAFQRLTQLKGAGADNSEVFKRLTAEFGLTSKQITQLSVAYKELQARQSAAAKAAADEVAQRRASADATKAALADQKAQQQSVIKAERDRQKASADAAKAAEASARAQQQAAARSAQQAGANAQAILALTKTLGQGYNEALKFSQALGSSGETANKAFQRFSQLRGAGADTITAYRQLSQEFGLNAQQLKVVNKAYQDLQVRQAGAAASAKQFGQSQQKAYADASNTIADLASKVASAQRSLGNASDNKQASRSAALFAENLRYKQEMAKIQNAGFSPQDIASAQQLANELNKLNIQKIEQDFNQLSTTAKAGLQQIAIAAGAVATAVAALFAAGLKEFTEFDGAIRQSGAVAGATEDELKALSDEVTRLGSTTTKAPADIARMSTELARAGFTSEETTAALEGIVFASEATGESLSTVGDIIAKTLRVFNKDAEDSGEVADLLVQTANSTNTSVGGLGESLKYVGAQAAASNQDLETILISLGLLGDAGIQGTQAGSNLAQALERLKIASAGSVTQFQGLVRGQKGATAAFEAINAQVRDSEGNLKQITEIVPIIKAQLGGLAQEDQEVLLKALFGVQGGRAFQTLLNASPARIAEVTQAVQDAQGVAGETSELLRQGLSGAVALFQGTASTFLKEFGQIAAVPVEPLVRGATELIRTFNNLPGPIQGALVAATGFIGVLATATLAIATYNLANGKLIIGQTLAAGKIVLNTTATGANALAKGAAAAAELAWALATRTATAAQQQQAASIATNIGKFGLLSAAIGSVALAVNEYQESTKALEGTQEAIDDLTESTLKLKEAFADAAQGTPEEGAAQMEAIAANIQSVKDGFSQVDKLLEAIREKLAFFSDNFTVLPDGIFSTKLETQLNNQSIQFEQFRQDIEKNVLGPYEDLANAEGGLPEADPAKLAAVEESIDKAIAGLERYKETTPEAAFAIDVLTKSLESSKLSIDQQRDAQLELNEATEEGEQRINDQIKALEEQQKAAAQERDDKRADDELTLTRRLDDERLARQEANANEIAQIQERNAEEIAQIEKRNNAEISEQEKRDAAEIAQIEKENAIALQEAERAFEQEISSFEEQRQQALQAKEAAFQRGQQQQEAAFQERQQAIEEQFQEEQRQRNEAQTQNFDRAEQLADLEAANTTAQRQNIEQQIRATDRVAQLNLADQILSPERINQLARQIAEVGSSVDNEDEARRVQEALGLIRAEQQRQQAEADRLAEQKRQEEAQAREAKFQAEQEQRRVAFEEAIAQQRATLEAEIEARKLAFEETVLTPLREEQEQRIATLREQQEIYLTGVREEQERNLQALREEQEAALEERRSRFEAAERQLDRDYEDEKRERDRQYREQQRLLDRQNEEAIANIRARSRSDANQTPTRETAFGPDASFGFSARGLRKGGTYQAGEPLQLHKDEFVIPSTDGTVLSQRASRAVVREAIASNPHLIAANLRRNAATIRPSVRVGGRATDDKLLKEMQGLRRDLKAIGRPTETTNLNVGVSDRRTVLREKARALSNELSRRG